MTNLKKVFALTAMVFTISAGSLSVYAASNYNTPAEALAGLTGRTYESVTAERSNTGTTYGGIASAAGVLTEFKFELLEMQKDQLAAKVAAGSLTQSEADSLLVTMQEQQASCTGEGSGIKAALGMGRMSGNQQQIGAGSGQMNGSRLQDGTGFGGRNNAVQNGLRDQSCLVTE
ncbi:MAG: hypothetical protein LLG09_03990 [Negativicutes bacterium]|nr:hypothetical protein [Negativicutes bacterium]